MSAACAPAPPPGIDPPAGCDKVYAVIAERAEGGKAAELEVLSEEPPQLLNPRDVQRRMEDSAASLPLDTAVYVARLRYRVTAQGGAEQIAVVRPSAAAGFDTVAIWGVGQARFAPARVNGCPVSVWIEQDLTVQSRRNRRRAAPVPPSRVQP
ncbi:MAG TPA: energy transducer TonB [Longimicrobium sp.]|nr:energy transducer TonB [Longimicrobium sp.]